MYEQQKTIEQPQNVQPETETPPTEKEKQDAEQRMIDRWERTLRRMHEKYRDL